MKVQKMSEITSAAAAAGATTLKAIGGLAAGSGIGAGLAAFVVMSMTKPATDKEWRVALASTIAASIGGGAALIKYLHIENWSADVFGLAGLGGLMFACGLPGWALVRALFVYLNKRKDAGLDEIVKDVKEMV